MDYEAVIGLETHVQLKTRSKMWCGCANAFGAPPNTLVCPVCLGLPGVLPVPNAEALRLTALAGLLLHCQIPARAKFDRKNYFYPDMPKNYQISQYDLPSAVGGYLDFESEGAVQRVRITRAHLEEDVGKSTHFDRHSGLDFNRAGVPLLEIVSEPDLTGADMAYEYLCALKELLLQGGVSDCDMEKGMVRCDVNVSVRPCGTTGLGAKIEIKNMNSFSGVRRALACEIPRQMAEVRAGRRLRQETRRWDDVAGLTEPMRTKEEAHDYRYFPEPDLMPIEPSPEWLAGVQARLGERPLDRKQRLMREYELPAEAAETLKGDVEWADYFERLAPQCREPRMLANWVINSLRARLAESGERLTDLRFPPAHLLELLDLIQSGIVSSRTAQEVFDEMFKTGGSPRALVEQLGLAQVSDANALETVCDEVIAAHPKSAADYRQGKMAALNFLKGQVMRRTQGRANPNLAGEILQRRLRV
jgi:aspartyl-tRNA(Asn)/glutamyl-tRNA(Gln) amidotransferase subunit B